MIVKKRMASRSSGVVLHNNILSWTFWRSTLGSRLVSSLLKSISTDSVTNFASSTIDRPVSLFGSRSFGVYGTFVPLPTLTSPSRCPSNPIAVSKSSPIFFSRIGGSVILARCRSPCVAADVTEDVVEAESRLLPRIRGDSATFLML